MIVWDVGRTLAVMCCAWSAHLYCVEAVHDSHKPKHIGVLCTLQDSGKIDEFAQEFCSSFQGFHACHTEYHPLTDHVVAGGRRAPNTRSIHQQIVPNIIYITVRGD